MPLDPQARAVLDGIAALGDPPTEESTPAAVRMLWRSRLKSSTVLVGEIRDIDAGGVPSRWYRPASRQGRGLLVYFHGGGWVLGDLDSHDDVARALAAGSGHAVLSVGYRLAPEHPYPAGLDDAAAALSWAHGHAADLGCDPTRIAVGGDSAGGNLAAVVAQQGVAPLRLQVLIYPITDASMAWPSYRSRGRGGLLTTAQMRWFVDHYLSGGSAHPDDPAVSPLLADDTQLAGSPPALVITAEYDPLRDEGRAYAGRLRSLGVPVTFIHCPGMFHGFLSFAEMLDEGRRVLDEVSATLARALE